MAGEVEKDKEWNQTNHIKFLTQGCNNYSMGATAASSSRNS